jgi:N-acetylglucosaminyldiphosphoundecaprenol N-acetyl-beta-D-mannosaminyltransferase
MVVQTSVESEARSGMEVDISSYDVLGVRLAALQIPTLIQHMEACIARRQLGNLLVFANVHVVLEAQHDEAFKKLLNESFTVPDGSPLIWIGRHRGFKLRRRVYGPDLMLDFLTATGSKYRHFFYGGIPGVADELEKIIKRKFETNVVGVYSPPFRPLTAEEDAYVVEMINASNADIVWVGLGCPKQEKWAYAHRALLKVPIMAAVGQAFDIHSGTVRQAPSWMRENGLEWFYRLLLEPRRLWKRYLVYNSEFIIRLLMQSFSTRETETARKSR